MNTTKFATIEVDGVKYSATQEHATVYTRGIEEGFSYLTGHGNGHAFHSIPTIEIVSVELTGLENEEGKIITDDAILEAAEALILAGKGEGWEDISCNF